MRYVILASCLALLAACNESDSSRPAGAAPAAAFQPAFPALNFEAPVFLTAVPGSTRLAVVTQEGRIYSFENRPDVTSTGTLLDIRDRVLAGGEMGLLGLAFDPDYANNGYLYVNYTADNPRHTVIARFTVTNGAADPASEVVLLKYEQPYSNHNGGMLAFGPDGYLYIAAGDGGSGGDPQNNAQQLGNLLGKILRIQTTPGDIVPTDNPFIGTTGARGEIWAYGLRNPWRFSFDRASGMLWVGDVGQNAWEEIDVISKGGNYGWRLFEGTHDYNNPGSLPASNFIAPLHEYSHDQGQSITGGYVYRGSAVPDLRGRYIYADFVSSRVWALEYLNGSVLSNTQIATVPNPSSFGEDAASELYITSFDGSIYKLTATGN